MFSNLFGNLQSYIQEFLFIIPVILISLPIHEFAHAMTATALGDPTAKNAGRLTLNPLAHLDPIGALCILLVHFGWAKPVPVNPNLMRNRKAGMAITALAGPVSNVIIAFVFAGVLKIMTLMNLPQTSVIEAIGIIFYYFVLINIGLAIFNLIPIPPLDGSRILAFFLPPKLEMLFYQYEKYLYIAIIILLFTGLLTVPLTFLINSVMNSMWMLFRM
jgi:Zn-dependent protease